MTEGQGQLAGSLTAGQTCAACGAGLRAGVRFCTACGASLAVGCPSCGATAEPGERFCGQCGGRLPGPEPKPAAPPPAVAAEAERKQVTVLFADVAGSMELAEQLDPDVWTTIVQRLFALCSAAVQRYGGTVDKFTGDGLMALFGAPVAQEDHARRACHAALQLVRDAAAYAAELRPSGVELAVRVGLNSGEVVAGAVGTGYTAVGHTVGLAQRMEGHAAPGTVCLSEHTARLVSSGFRLRDLGRVHVRGVALPVGAYELESVAVGPTVPVPGSTRLVGRDAELQGLLALLDEAEQSRAQIVGVVGEAGAGKSRLCEELARRAAERGVTVRRTAGVSHAQDAPLLPVQGLLANYFAISESDSPPAARAKIAAGMLDLDVAFEAELGLVFDFMGFPDPGLPAPQLGPEARRRRVLDVFRRASARRSERGTRLLLLLEDLHWFDPHSVEFLTEWVPTFPNTRTLVVMNFRPEFQPPWARHSYYRQIPLVPLDQRAADELLAELLGSSPDPELDLLARQIRDRTGGNPFFLEEIVRGLASEGTLEGGPGNYRLVRPAHDVRVPPTVQGVLAARIDRLAPQDKAVLAAAAVIGRIFSAEVLGAVAGVGPAELGSTLGRLCETELLQVTDSPGEYRFWHPLTQEVAYGGLLTATRRRHHRAVAEALLAASADRHDELASLLATHFEAAGDELATATWQMRAAARAIRTDYLEARRRVRLVLERLAALPETPQTLALAVRGRTFLLRLGARLGMEPAEAQQLFADALPAAEALGDRALLAGLSIARGVVGLFVGDLAAGTEAFQEGAYQADEAGSPGLRAFTWAAVAMGRVLTGPTSDGVAAADLATRVCGDDVRAGTDAAGFSLYDLPPLCRAMLHLPGGDLRESRRELRDAITRLGERPIAEWYAWALVLPAHLADWIGAAEPNSSELAEAVQDAQHAMRLAQDSGNIGALVKSLHALGVVDLLEGRAAAAERRFEDALHTARKNRSGLMEEGGLLTQLARVRLGCGDAAGARAAATEAVEVARRQGAGVVECLAHLVRARVWRETARGEADLTEAREAVAAGEKLAAEVGAGTYAAFLAEERARLVGGPLADVADGYDAIGATGHARRIRREIDALAADGPPG